VHAVGHDLARTALLQGIGGGAGIGCGTGLINGCTSEGAGFASQRLGQNDFAKAVIVEIFCNDQ